MRKVIGVIPARMSSERLPGKVLRSLAGRAMLHHVFERAQPCSLLSELWVATDSEEVSAYCTRHGIPVLMTAAAHQSGTERICEVMRRTSGEIFVNLQADEPMLNSRHVSLLVEPFLRDPATQVTTLKTRLDSAHAENPNIVKVVTNSKGQALYFSRAPIPYRRSASSTLPLYKHLGLYAYCREALARYQELAPSSLELAERLEQLRFLEHGIPIQVAETLEDTIGVDTEDDWRAVVQYFEGLRTQD